MPEEIFVTCVYCNKTFNVEWQGVELKEDETGVCGRKECIEKHKEVIDTRNDKKMEGY